MLRRSRFRWVAGAAAAALATGTLVAGAGPANATGLDPVDLGTLPGGCCAQPFAINGRFVVAGTAYVGPPGSAQHAFRHDARGMTDLGTLPGGDTSHGSDVNNFGDVVGASTFRAGDSFTFHATLWRQGKVIDLGTLGGPSSSAEAINDHGQIVGWSELANGESHVFLWQRGVMTDLGPGSATGINERGDVVGVTGIGPDNRPAIWHSGVMTVLPLPARAVYGGAADINEHGQVLAYYVTATNNVGGEVIDGNRVTDLGLPPGDADFSPLQLNDSGVVAGFGRQTRNAVIWQAGQFIELPPLSTNFGGMAMDVDNRGHVVGMAGKSSQTTFEDHLVMWTVPPDHGDLPG